MPYKDPEKARQCARETYHRNKHNGKHHANVRAHYWRRRALVSEAKDKPCVDCGGRFPPECMDFDHVRGEKVFNIGQSLHRSIARLLEEIEKCDLVCANCHRMRTVQRNRESGDVLLKLPV